MVRDPYSVLGISRDATKDEIKAAYRKKAKQYHPDLHPNDPTAAEKMHEVNEAYDMLSNPEKYRTRGEQYQGSQGAYGGGSYSQGGYGQNTYGQGTYGQGPFWQGTYWRSTGGGIQKPVCEPGDSDAVRQAIEFINRGRCDLAGQILQQIVSGERNGRWHYLCAITNYGLGNHIRALEEIKAALQTEPENLVYQQVYQSMSAESRQYRDAEGEYQRAAAGMGRFCLSLCWLNCLCGCC